ncbi:MAG: hypothetical protein WC317_07725 [Candidatus Omnitrophota bacterium]|jgi:hypothetical protein
MKETQFWAFLERMWEERGREPMMAGQIDDLNPNVQAVSHYIMSHALLPRDYANIHAEAITMMGRLLLEKGIQRKTREAIMIILAHHGSEAALYALRIYSVRPKPGLEIFSRMALEECESWQK